MLDHRKLPEMYEKTDLQVARKEDELTPLTKIMETSTKIHRKNINYRPR